MLTKEQILGSKDLHVTRVEIPEWGGPVFLRAFTLADRIELEARPDNADVAAASVNAVAIALCDADGNRLFHGDDIDALKAKNANVLLRLFRQVAKINALSKKDVEEIVKNGEAAPLGATTSASPND